MVLMNIPNRGEWLPSLQKVEQQIPAVFVGSIHHCTFTNHEAVVSPMQMTVTTDEITYTESYRIEERDLSLIHDFIFTKTDETSCIFSWRFLNAGKTEIGSGERLVILEGMQQVAESLKEHCEKLEESAFV